MSSIYLSVHESMINGNVFRDSYPGPAAQLSRSLRPPRQYTDAVSYRGVELREMPLQEPRLSALRRNWITVASAFGTQFDQSSK